MPGVSKHGGSGLRGRALVLLIALTAAGCGQQPARPSPAPATHTGRSSSPAPSSQVPLLAVVSEAQEGPCAVTTLYKHGAKVIFRIKLFDPATGRQLTDKNLSAVSVDLADGTKLPAKFGTHEEGKVPFWTAGWTVPASYPTGQVKYTVTARGINRHVNQVRFDVNDSQAFLTVVEGTAAKGA